VAEGPWSLNRLLQSLPVLYVTGIVADPTIEDILQCVFSQKLVTENSHGTSILKIDPQVP
jgi:hypothetical protein